MNVRVILPVVAALVVAAALVNAQMAPAVNPEYVSRAAALKADDAKGHFDLGLWAFKNGLFGEAQTEADKLLALDKDDARAAYLKLAAEFYKTGGMPIVPPPPIQPPTTPTTPESAGVATAGLTDEQVTAVYKQYGDKVMTSFKELQDKVLIPSCANKPECHNNPQVKFYLTTENRGDKKMLATNVKAMEPYLNTMDLPKSRILSIAMDPATEHKGGIVFRKSNQYGYNLLEKWVKSVPSLWGGSSEPPVNKSYQAPPRNTYGH